MDYIWLTHFFFHICLLGSQLQGVPILATLFARSADLRSWSSRGPSRSECAPEEDWSTIYLLAYITFSLNILTLIWRRRCFFLIHLTNYGLGEFWATRNNQVLGYILFGHEASNKSGFGTTTQHNICKITTKGNKKKSTRAILNEIQHVIYIYIYILQMGASKAKTTKLQHICNVIDKTTKLKFSKNQHRQKRRLHWPSPPLEKVLENIS